MKKLNKPVSKLKVGLLVSLYGKNECNKTNCPSFGNCKTASGC